MLNIFKKRGPSINIVTEASPGWVLRWISDTYAKHLPNTKVSTAPDFKADINFYVNYNLFEKKTNIDIGYFTHREKEGPLVQKFDDVAAEVDWCISMCKETSRYLPEDKTTINLIPPDKQFMKGNIVFGVVGTEKSSGRKRYKWVEELKKINGIEIIMTNGQYEWKNLPDFYKKIDYLLILSDNEGGPLPLVEALAMGKPVITSNVGFSNEYTALRFNTFEELKTLIQGLVIREDAWEKSSKDLYDVFLELYKNKIYQFP